LAGIYIHIPFCKQRCHYCNFHFSTSLHYKNEFLQALLNEMKLQQHYLGTQLVKTIYFGGGTPSLLSPQELATITEALHTYWQVQPGAEITLEANPDDVTEESLAGWKQAGINRLSIGIQSLNDAELQWMNRAHTAEEARMVIDKARKAGFEDFSVDLIYGSPLLSDEQWMATVQWVLEQQITHLSCYGLTVEPQTPLDKFIRTGQRTQVSNEQQSRQFLLLMDALQQAGWEHYEISNFARPGHRSRHNSAYWQGKHYLGLGPSAHSFNGHTRQWNVAHNRQYIEALEKGELLFEKEALTPVQQLNEYIMTSLRLLEGCNLAMIAEEFGEATAQQLRLNAVPFINREHLQLREQHLLLTRDGKLFADGIASDLFFDTV
jgi:oxygen-independent coproporphyrinogen III oxidase